jgi:hypothetical protein
VLNRQTLQATFHQRTISVGIGPHPKPLNILAKFYELSEHLLSAAAEQSEVGEEHGFPFNWYVDRSATLK